MKLWRLYYWNQSSKFFWNGLWWPYIYVNNMVLERWIRHFRTNKFSEKFAIWFFRFGLKNLCFGKTFHASKTLITLLWLGRVNTEKKDLLEKEWFQFPKLTLFTDWDSNLFKLQCRSTYFFNSTQNEKLWSYKFSKFQRLKKVKVK